MALADGRPVFIEVMSYRRGHHSTSDDSTRYRSVKEINEWAALCPLRRMRSHMESRGWWSEALEKELRDEERLGVLTALETAERKVSPSMNELFSDVYDAVPEHLKRQERELLEHIAKYPEHYAQTPH
jgi:2-oxoisovalerate dehydrogenase E1 component alpha subunit